MIIALLLAAASVPSTELIGGLPAPYVQLLCDTGQRKGGFVRAQVRNRPFEDQVAILRYCVIYDRGVEAGLRRAELPESRD